MHSGLNSGTAPSPVSTAMMSPPYRRRWAVKLIEQAIQKEEAGTAKHRGKIRAICSWLPKYLRSTRYLLAMSGTTRTSLSFIFPQSAPAATAASRRRYSQPAVCVRNLGLDFTAARDGCQSKPPDALIGSTTSCHGEGIRFPICVVRRSTDSRTVPRSLQLPVRLADEALSV